MRQHIRSFDRAIDAFIHRLPSALRPLMITLSLLGQPILTIGVAAGIIGLGIGRQFDTLIIAGAIAIITISLGSLLKLILRRKRPLSTYSDRLFFDTFSFPSGHAVGSLTSYGLLALFALMQRDIPFTVIAACLALIIFGIGLSRVYLRAHFSSDVLGGWCIGAIGLAFSAIVLFT